MFWKVVCIGVIVVAIWIAITSRIQDAGWWLLFVGLVCFVWFYLIEEPTKHIAQSVNRRLDSISKGDTHEWFLTQQNLHLHGRGDPTRPEDWEAGRYQETRKRK